MSFLRLSWRGLSACTFPLGSSGFHDTHLPVFHLQGTGLAVLKLLIKRADVATHRERNTRASWAGHSADTFPECGQLHAVFWRKHT